ncbi:MAG: DUF2924 domain-containing protein [Hyphomicrobiaceae bacterium]|nr:DUF2924 domain-containing protein [Hyphomicrobiaceae bacterium]
MIDNTTLARVAVLKTASTPELKKMWSDLFDTQPPPYNRRFLESRLAYRIQELATGGMTEQVEKRLETVSKQSDYTDPKKAANRITDKPVAGTRLIREWQGTEYCVTVLADGFEYQGRPYKSLSAIARAITGTRWNGPLFFGLRKQGGRK